MNNFDSNKGPGRKIWAPGPFIKQLTFSYSANA